MHARRQTNCRSSESSPAARARVALVPNDSAVRVTLLASAVIFPVSDGAAFITGETLCVNGGQYLQ